MLKKTILKSLLFGLILLETLPTALALPIDWNGSFGVDTTLINNFRKVKGTTDNSNSSLGSQEVPLATGRQSTASFQSYIFKLSPVLIVNDSASLFGEITTGYGRGGRFGDSSTQTSDPSFGNALYLNNTADLSNEAGKNRLLVNKLYAVLYSDTVTYYLGRQSRHWGLGAIINSGDNSWDRHVTAHDGITMKLKIGNFQLSPYWAKISSEDSLTRATNAKEYGASILFDNTENEISFGAHYSKKQNNNNNQSIKTNVSNDTSGPYALGLTNIKFLDLYFKKSFNQLHFSFEFPLITGEIGNLFRNNQHTRYKAKAFIWESNYNLNANWNLGLNLGQVDGDSGSGSSFEAMFLHPNYQIANLLFRYNMRAIASPDTTNLYDSFVTNCRYAKLFAELSYSRWIFNAAAIYAVALEVAKNGSNAYNHSTNKLFNAVGNQKKDLGYEIDLDANYQWNNEVKLGASLGYLITGNYFAYTSSTTVTNKATNSFVGQLRAALDF